MTFYIYTDGHANPNPGPTGTGVAVYDSQGKLVKALSGRYESNGTNNTAELYGILEGLLVDLPDSQGSQGSQGSEPDRIILSDSQYAINSSSVWAEKWKSKGWKFGINSRRKIKNLDLIKEIYGVYSNSTKTQLQKVKGHSGDTGNDLADLLAGIATGSAMKELPLERFTKYSALKSLPRHVPAVPVAKSKSKSIKDFFSNSKT